MGFFTIISSSNKVSVTGLSVMNQFSRCIWCRRGSMNDCYQIIIKLAVRDKFATYQSYPIRQHRILGSDGNTRSGTGTEVTQGKPGSCKTVHIYMYIKSTG
jgi:hypothetical protein